MSNTPVTRRIDEIKGMNDFPMPKGPALALIRLTQREFVSLAVVAHAIKADPTFAVRAIRVANGIAGADHGPVVSLRDAVDVLGVPPVRSLAMGFSLLESHRGEQCAGFDGKRFWAQSLARAVALQLLVASRPDLSRADAFSVGLLARVGELVLATLFPQAFGALLQRRAGKRDANPALAEQEAMGAGAASLSASILLDYNLPEAYAEAAESLGGSHALEFAKDVADPKLHQLLRLADHIGDVCVAPETNWRAMMPALFAMGESLSLDATELIALCHRVAHEWREWGANLVLETGPMPRFEQIELTPLSAVAAPASPAVGVAAPPVATAISAPVAPAPAVAKPASPVPASAALHVLLVGDPARVRLSLRAQLIAAGHRLVEADNGRQGLATAIELQPQVVLVDARAAELDGIELVRTLRQFKTGRGIYALLLGDQADEDQLVRAFEAGADGYLALPPSPRALAAHLLAGLRVASLQEELRHDQEELRRMSAELSASNQKLQEAGMTDMLTGCPNRRYAMDRLNQEWAMAVRTERPLACMVIDLDNLKQINDGHGHDAGDRSLKLVASAFKGEMRAQEVLARSGGDEFIVICPDTSLDAALACAERMRAAAAAQPIVGGALPVHTSVSIGVAVRDASTPDPETLLRLADQSAYLAKRNRNSVATMQTVARPGRPA
ncbi:MAG: diguanylate cyclase [Rhodocyclales bacterium]|nr:diguanylate cyclase [Rhodocyclales bacterium]